MPDVPIIERIDSDLEELMERFFENSKKDLNEMQATLDAGDMVTLARMGHTAKGTGYGYGMRGMGDIGLALEEAAKAEDMAQCQEAIGRMEHYLDTVKVEYKN